MTSDRPREARQNRPRRAASAPARRSSAPAPRRAPRSAAPATSAVSVPEPTEPIEPAGAEQPPLPSSFDGLGLPEPLLAELARQGVTRPFPIQAATLPGSLAGRDVLGRGRTGSGKTLAFGLALLARTAGGRAEARRPLGLVLVPTRELAQQVEDSLTPYAKALRLRMTTVVGGMSIGRQATALRNGAEVLIATPGRLIDLIGRGDCRLDQVRTTVLDEADRMADLGFLPQVTRLLEQTDPDGQRLLFSATLDDAAGPLARRFLTDPVRHSVDPPAGAVVRMDHHVLRVSTDDKRAVTVRIAAREGRVLLFIASKRAVDRMVKTLLAQGVRAAALHGGKSQAQRTRVLAQFKSGEVTTLVATDVAARGIHVDDLDLVVNVDPPADHKDYLHRGGRTARAGASGTVVTLVLPEQNSDVTKMLAKAGVTAKTARLAAPDDPELARLTGAREPSGVPIVVTPAPAPAGRAATGTGTGAARPAGSRRSGGGSGGGRRGGGSGRPAAAPADAGRARPARRRRPAA